MPFKSWDDPLPGFSKRSILFVWGLCICCVLLMVTSLDSLASTLSSVEVTQPIGTEEGLWLGCTTYVGYFGPLMPGLEIGLTCDSNAVVTPWGPKNLNAANIAGLRVSVRRIDAVPRLGEDTILVVVDASSVGAGRVRVSSVSVDTVVAATVECIRENAARGASRWPQVKHLRVSFIGPPRFARYDGVYVVNPGVRRREFR